MDTKGGIVDEDGGRGSGSLKFVTTEKRVIGDFMGRGRMARFEAVVGLGVRTVRRKVWRNMVDV